MAVKAYTYAPSEIFGTHIRYVVPLFQRPYVWTRDEQWAPLWEDVRRVAETVLSAPAPVFGASPVPPHFLGAIVVEAHESPTGFIAVRHVIDGQQRLTTLQLLLDAAQLVVQAYGDELDAAGLRNLVLNNPTVTQQPDEVFKVWPTDRDQDAFRAAMDDEVQLTGVLAGSSIGRAHTFFAGQVTDWALAEGAGAARTRLHALVRALHDHLKLVVIDLERGDNAQVIFETLNHRGADLLAADLVKNLLFQLAASQHQDVHELYREYWKSLDTDFWRTPTRQGRLFRPRIDLFLNHWLTMKLVTEVATDRVFTAFRDDLVKPGLLDAADLMAELARDADIYARFDDFPSGSVEGRFHYRVVRALDAAVVSPLLLWLLRHDEMPSEQRHKALRSLESWLVRRALLRATSKDHNRAVLDLLKALDAGGPAIAGDTTEAFLAAQRADSRYWPDDQALQESLAAEPLYKSLTRPRLRMILEALEDDLRSPLGEGTACPRNLTVEHVMPQGWREHWGADIAGDEIAELHRDRHVHALGNLTLVSGRLNPALSNRPWTDAEAVSRNVGEHGKRSYLLKHSELKLNADLITREAGWSEVDIAARTYAFAERITRIWPHPTISAVAAGHLPTEQDEDGEPGPGGHGEGESVESGALPGHSGKYRALWLWLQDQVADEVTFRFEEVEQILQLPLPPSAREHLTHWYGYEGTALGRAIRDAGWRASGVNLTSQFVTFVRAEAHEEEHA